jgi:hypothetical protein
MSELIVLQREERTGLLHTASESSVIANKQESFRELAVLGEISVKAEEVCFS